MFELKDKVIASIVLVVVFVASLWFFTKPHFAIQERIKEAEQTENTDTYIISYETSIQIKNVAVISVVDIEKTDDKIVYTLLDNEVIEVSDSYTTWTHADGSIDTLSNVAITKTK